MINVKTLDDVPVGAFYKNGIVFSEIIAKKINEGYTGTGLGKVVVTNGGVCAPAVDLYSVWPTEDQSDSCSRIYSAEYVDNLSDPDITVRRAKDCPLINNSKYGSPAEVGLALLSSSDYYFDSGETPVRGFLRSREEVGISAIRFAIGLHRPCKEDGGKVSIYRDAVDYKRDRRTTLKAGRAFRHMFPSADDKSIASLAEAWLEQSAPRDLTFKVGRSAEDFTRAYDHDTAPFRNPTQTSFRKSIASSCMQGVGREYRDEVGIWDYASVGAAYASGDFEIAWVEDKDGHIAGRVVYSVAEGHKNTSGPLYGACEQSLDMLQDHLTVNGIEYDVEAWSGLRLKCVGPKDDPVVPYLDGDLGGSVTYGGEFIELCYISVGEFTFDGTDGFGRRTTGTCECCGGGGFEHEELHRSDYGPYCEYCFDEAFTYLECGTVVDREEAVEAYIFLDNAAGGRTLSQVIHIDDAVYCEEYDEYWHQDYVTIDDEGVERPTHLIPDQLELDLEEAA